MSTKAVKKSRSSKTAEVASELIDAASDSSFDVATFFRKFELLADTQGAIEKFRGTVLHFAFRGLMTEREDDCHDEELLNKVDSDVKALAGQKRSQSKRQMVEPATWPCDLPESWHWTTLGRIATWGSGSTPKRGNAEFYNGTTTWLKSGELNDRRDLIGSDEKVTDVAMKQCSFRQNHKGDVLFAMYGATVGKVAILGEQAVTNQAVCGCTPSKYVNNVFLFYYLLSQRKTFRDTSEGGAQPNFSKDKIVNFPFPLPPLAEQKRIVAKVDDLMGLCDRLEALESERQTRHAALSHAALARFADSPTPTNLQFIFHNEFDVEPAELRNLILSLAVQGRLVERDIRDENAETLFDRIQATRYRLVDDGIIAKIRDPIFDKSRSSFELPHGWMWVTLSSLCEIITKGSSPKWQGVSYTDKTNGLLFITSENVGNYQLRKLDDLKYVERKFNEIEPRSILQRGDVLMTLVGASIGRTAVFTLDETANINQAVAMIRIVRGFDYQLTGYLLHYLNSPFAIDLMLGSRVTTAQPNISLTNAKEFPVPLPPLAEQKRIVAKVDELMAFVDTLEKQLAHSRTLGKQLLQAVVAELTMPQ